MGETTVEVISSLFRRKVILHHGPQTPPINDHSTFDMITGTTMTHYFVLCEDRDHKYVELVRDQFEEEIPAACRLFFLHFGMSSDTELLIT